MRIEGSTRHITVESNTIRETRTGEEATQKVDIYIGPKADYITCQQNHFEGNLKGAILDESQGTNNKLELAAPTQSSIQ